MRQIEQCQSTNVTKGGRNLWLTWKGVIQGTGGGGEPLLPPWWPLRVRLPRLAHKCVVSD